MSGRIIRHFGAGFLVALVLLTAPRVWAAELVMIEAPDCSWCQAWHRDVGAIYGKTPEGRRAPLRRVTAGEPLPDDLPDIDGAVYTPTFVVIDDRGREVGRIQGYPGEDFFWALLEEILDRLPGEALAGR